jgi:hypothetical protein
MAIGMVAGEEVVDRIERIGRAVGPASPDSF